MQKRGIPTIVWMTPILPFINDTEENIRKILDECVRCGVKGIINMGMGVTLREGDREYFYAALDKHFPGLKDRYIKTYGDAYEVPSPNASKLWKILRDTCRANGMLIDDECFKYMNDLPDKQISIFDL
jgi:DNA repair photolyase